MTDNLLKSIVSDLWSAADYYLSIEIPITTSISVTPRGVLYIFTFLLICMPIIHLVSSYRR